MGIYKMGTRYYDPALGRFTQVDPVEGGAATAYDYAALDPVNNVDTDGQFCVRCGIAVELAHESRSASHLASIGRRVQVREYTFRSGNRIAPRRKFPFGIEEVTLRPVILRDIEESPTRDGELKLVLADALSDIGALERGRAERETLESLVELALKHFDDL